MRLGILTALFTILHLNRRRRLSGNEEKASNLLLQGEYLFMNIVLYDIQYDNVIKSFYLTISVDYEYAIKKLVPLINKLDFQRNPLRASFYKRLEVDIQSGCIMPNITIAIKANQKMPEKDDITEQYINDNLDNDFILDGIQR